MELGSNSNRRWMVLASSPVVSVRRLAARPVGAHSSTSIFFALRIWRILVTIVVFPTPGPPVITVTLLWSAVAMASRCEGESVRLVCCSTQGMAFAGSIRPQGSAPLRRRSRCEATPTSARWEGSQKEARLPIDLFSNEMLFLAFHLNRLLNDRHRDFQEGRRCLNQFIVMHGIVAIFGKFLENVMHPRLSTDHCIPWNVEPLRQGIGRLETNAVDVQGEPIGILPYACNGFVAVGLVNAYRTRSPDAVGVQKDHDLSDHFLLGPRLAHPLFAFGANTVKVGQAFRRLLNDIKDLCPKGLDQLFGKVRSDTFDHPRAEILLNPFESTGVGRHAEPVS